jgi:hypothetical protein
VLYRIFFNFDHVSAKVIATVTPKNEDFVPAKLHANWPSKIVPKYVAEGLPCIMLDRPYEHIVVWGAIGSVAGEDVDPVLEEKISWSVETFWSLTVEFNPILNCVGENFENTGGIVTDVHHLLIPQMDYPSR